jgi:hypothetical protein
MSKVGSEGEKELADKINNKEDNEDDNCDYKHTTASNITSNDDKNDQTPIINKKTTPSEGSPTQEKKQASSLPYSVMDVMVEVFKDDPDLKDVVWGPNMVSGKPFTVIVGKEGEPFTYVKETLDTWENVLGESLDTWENPNRKL